MAWKVLLPTVNVDPSGRLLKVPAIGVAAVLRITVRTRPWVKVPCVCPLKLKLALLLMVTPLATTLSVLACLRFALNV